MLTNVKVTTKKVLPRHHSKTAVGIWVSADTTAAVTIMRAGQLVGHNGPS